MAILARSNLKFGRVILKLLTVQRVKHKKNVSNAWQLRKIVRHAGIMQVIKPKTRGVNSGLAVTKLLAGGALCRVCV